MQKPYDHICTAICLSGMALLFLTTSLYAAFESSGAGITSDDLKPPKNRRIHQIPQRNVTWEKTYGSALQEKAYGVCAMPDGGAVIVGNRKSLKGRGHDAWILRLDKFGNEVRQRVVGGNRNDQVYAVAVTKDRIIGVAGPTRSVGRGSSDVWVLGLNENGSLLWEKTYGGIADDRARSIAVSADCGSPHGSRLYVHQRLHHKQRGGI